MHLLNRFTFGPQNREADVLVYVGLEHWLDEQLRADLPESDLEKRLKVYPALGLNGREMANTYLREDQMEERAMAEGGLKRPDKNATPEARAAFRVQAVSWANALIAARGALPPPRKDSRPAELS